MHVHTYSVPVLEIVESVPPAVSTLMGWHLGSIRIRLLGSFWSHSRCLDHIFPDVDPRLGSTAVPLQLSKVTAALTACPLSDPV